MSFFENAIRNAMKTLADPHLCCDIGGALTCEEADALAKVFLYCGHYVAAEALLTSHGESDEDPATTDTDDWHHGVDAKVHLTTLT